jgi:hypothetical protein
MRDVLLKIWKEWVSELAPLFSLFWHLREAGASGIFSLDPFLFSRTYRTFALPHHLLAKKYESLFSSRSYHTHDLWMWAKELLMPPKREHVWNKVIMRWTCSTSPIALHANSSRAFADEKGLFLFKKFGGRIKFSTSLMRRCISKTIDTIFKSCTLIRYFVFEVIPCLDMEFYKCLKFLLTSNIQLFCQA